MLHTLYATSHTVRYLSPPLLHSFSSPGIVCPPVYAMTVVKPPKFNEFGYQSLRLTLTVLRKGWTYILPGPATEQVMVCWC